MSPCWAWLFYLPFLYSICQERGLWNCTAHHCPRQWALCPQELIYVPGACLLTCDSPSANHSCLARNTDGCVCPPGTVLLVRLEKGPMGQQSASPYTRFLPCSLDVQNSVFTLHAGQALCVS